MLARESVVVLLGCLVGRLIGSPNSPGCSIVLFNERVGRQPRLARSFDRRAGRLVARLWKAFWALFGHPVPRYPI
jgi:hypothetical protein